MMIDKSKKPPRRRRLGNILLAMVLASLLIGLGGYFLATHAPAFYQPAAERDRQKLLDDAISFGRRLQDFVSNNIISERGEPLELSDDEVNGYLAAVNDPEIWEMLAIRMEPWRKAFESDWLRNVQVEFSDGRVTVAGEVTWHDMDVVLSVSGLPEVDDDGQARLVVSGIRAGALPLPKFLFRSFLKDIDGRPLPAKVSHWRLKSVDIRDGKAVLSGRID